MCLWMAACSCSSSGVRKGALWIGGVEVLSQWVTWLPWVVSYKNVEAHDCGLALSCKIDTYYVISLGKLSHS